MFEKTVDTVYIVVHNIYIVTERLRRLSKLITYPFQVAHQ